MKSRNTPDPAGLSLRTMLKPYKRPLGRAWYLSVLSAVILIVQSALLAALFASWLAGMPPVPLLQKWLPWLVLCWLVRPILNYLKDRILLKTGIAVRTDLRARLLDRLAALGPARSHFGSDGALAGKVIDQADAVEGYVTRYAVQQRLAALTPLLIAASACYYSPLAAGLMLCTAPLVPIFMILVGRAAARKNREQLASLTRMGGRFLDLLRGLPTLRRLQAVDQAQQAVDDAAESYRARTMKVLSLAFLSTAVLELFSALAVALVAVYLGLGLIGVLPWAQDQIPVPYQGALFILLLAPEFYAPLRQLGSDYHDKAKAEAAVAELSPLLESEIGQDGGNVILPLDRPPAIVVENVVIRGDGGRVRLPETSFAVAAGERVLLAGKSGSGKSSLLQALLGFVPYEGRILMGDTDYREADKGAARGRMAYLAQTPPLLPAGIAENLRLPCPEADDAALQRVLEQVGMWDFVQKLPQGMNTVLGERGQGLSGGQLQRLAVAQMLLRDAPLWLLDEPAAHLDAQTGADIQALLDRLGEGKTVLLVSHDERNAAGLYRTVRLAAAGEESE